MEAMIFGMLMLIYVETCMKQKPKYLQQIFRFSAAFVVILGAFSAW